MTETRRVKRLSDLIADSAGVRLVQGADQPVAGLCYDSRAAAADFLFVAVPGTHVDGHEYVGAAAARGATAALVREDRLAAIAAVAPEGMALLAAADTRPALAHLSAAFYDHPGRKLRVVGVTGTDGKTTTTYLISRLLEAGGYVTGFAGTVDFKVGPRIWSNDSRQSTPESLDIQRLLAEMVVAGVDYAVLESTSHGLALDRLLDCEYDAGVFTNLSGEHLDFHGTIDQYRRDKARLFDLVRAGADKGIPKVAVLNADDPSSAEMRAHSPEWVVHYGLGESAEVTATDLKLRADGSRYRVRTPAGEAEVRTGLTGPFNVYNALAAIALAGTQGVPVETAAAALAGVTGFPGRMERIDCGQPFAVIVDYAHTPDSLRKVLEVGRSLTEGRLLAVFGSAGERDTEKRPKMGAVAAGLADFFVLADEDPRFEDAAQILEEIAAGARAAGGTEGRDFLRIEDRGAAIAAALERARPGDVVLLCGKGHEGCIIYGAEKVPWDERRAAREVLRGLGYGDGQCSDQGRA
jgi:UDP-N-acetylmuramoyl-L-alanyl-D-glutamate--2,6-diaminopimelate ligase